MGNSVVDGRVRVVCTLMHMGMPTRARAAIFAGEMKQFPHK